VAVTDESDSEQVASRISQSTTETITKLEVCLSVYLRVHHLNFHFLPMNIFIEKHFFTSGVVKRSCCW